MPKKDFLQARLAMTIFFMFIGLALPVVSFPITMEEIRELKEMGVE